MSKETHKTTNAIIQHLCYEGWAWRNPTNTGRKDRKLPTNAKGVADILGCVDGKLVEVEVKTGKDRMSEAQKKHKQLVEERGGCKLHFVVKDFDDFYEQWTRRNDD